MRFCVIGAGSGGRAFAAYLSSKGYPVSLYNRSFSRISEIQQMGGIEATGELQGFFPIEIVTQNLNLAMKDADIILVVTPAFAHKKVAKKAAPFLKDGQIIILNPGRTFGSVEFLKTVEERRGKVPIFVGEAQTLLFTSRELSENRVKIIKIKNSVKFTTFPDKYTDLIHEILKDIFPQLVPIDDYLEVTLNNIGMLLHPTITLFNAGPIDSGKEFNFYTEGVTRQLCQVLEEIEIELNEIFRRLGVRLTRYEKWANKCYGVDGNSIYEAIQKVEAYRNITSPKELITRYFTEDVPTGLVPISSIGKFLKLNTPTINSIIHLSGILCGMDFMKEGRTIKNLQIENYLRERLYDLDLLSKAIMIEDSFELTKTED